MKSVHGVEWQCQELKDSLGEVLVAITPEICRQVMLNVRRLNQRSRFSRKGTVFASWFSFASSRAANASRICVKSRIYALRQEGHQLVFFFLQRAPFLQKEHRFCQLVYLLV